MLEVLSYGWLIVSIVSFMVSIWYLTDPLGYSRFFSQKPDLLSGVVIIGAVGAWGIFFTKGMEVFLPFLSETKTIYDAELGEYVSKKEKWAQAIGYALAFIMVLVFIKVGEARKEQQLREEERRRERGY